MEEYNVKNGNPSTVTITAPGLVRLENDSLKIIGDTDIDKVIFDGCLKWTPRKENAATKKEDSGFNEWTATDPDGKKRSISISKGVPTTEHECDMRYLVRQDFLNLEIIERGLNAPYAGIGIGFQKNNEKVIVTHILPNSPADLAGIRPGYQLLRINGSSVDSLSTKAISMQIRGAEGTPISLTFISEESANEIEIKLIRQNIVP
jgi:C-terminal processing protease CtpA/Prc